MIYIENLIMDLDKGIPMYISLKGTNIAKIIKRPDEDLYKLLITDSVESGQFIASDFIVEKVLTLKEFREFLKRYYIPR